MRAWALVVLLVMPARAAAHCRDKCRDRLASCTTDCRDRSCNTRCQSNYMTCNNACPVAADPGKDRRICKDPKTHSYINCPPLNQAEPKKPDPKKAEPKKPDPKKAEPKKPDPKKKPESKKTSERVEVEEPVGPDAAAYSST